MENASKALLFAASTLIAVMLFAFMFYMFRRFSATARSTETKMSQSEIDKFNSKFINYDTSGREEVTITHVSRSVGTKSISKDYTYNRILGAGRFEKPNAKDYYKALVDISQSLNTTVDLVTAINDAIDVNYKNNNGYLYNNGSLEIQNSVEIIVDLGSSHFDFSQNGGSYYRYLVLEPNKSVKAKHIYGLPSGKPTPSTTGNNSKNKEKNVENYKTIFSDTNEISVYDILTELRDTAVVPKPSKLAESELDRQYTVYKYYFKGEVFINDFTNLVETVKFTLVEDKNFDENLK